MAGAWRSLIRKIKGPEDVFKSMLSSPLHPFLSQQPGGHAGNGQSLYHNGEDDDDIGNRQE